MNFKKNKFVISNKSSFFIPMGSEIQGDRDYETPKIRVRSFRALTRYPSDQNRINLWEITSIFQFSAKNFDRL